MSYSPFYLIHLRFSPWASSLLNVPRVLCCPAYLPNAFAIPPLQIPLQTRPPLFLRLLYLKYRCLYSPTPLTFQWPLAGSHLYKIITFALLYLKWFQLPCLGIAYYFFVHAMTLLLLLQKQIR